MDVQMTLFVYSLEGDAAEWFTEFDPDKFNTLDEILVEFISRWGDKKKIDSIWLHSLLSIRMRMRLWKSSTLSLITW
jgi:hypothetical protein